MGKRFAGRKILVLCLAATVFFPFTAWKNASADADGNVVIGQTIQDVRVIPDKYNTGAKGTLLSVGLGQPLGELCLKAGNNGTTNVLDFVYGNSHISGTVVFENLDFSAYPFALYHAAEVEKEIRLVFKNCRFSSVLFEKQDCLIESEFENCTFHSFYGSNATFERCAFGGSYTDGIVPFRNIRVNHCFFSDMTSVIAADKERHIDGTQIYGFAGLDAGNIEYNNCRFEIPSIGKEESTADVNACIMLQMEYSNADGIRFQDCIINGGGYSVYAWSKKDGFTLENVSFENIRFGCADKFGRFYPRLSSSVSLENIKDTDTLYVGSVWKENGATHFSVTNDTNEERILLIYTDKGRYEQRIAACPSGEQLNSEMTYEQLPFDLDVAIPVDCGYAVCFDGTRAGFAEQIRYRNWSGEPVVLSREAAAELYSGAEEPVLSGFCGDGISYVLSNTGVLCLEGEGATENYHSARPAPWAEATGWIKEIRVGEGIEHLGDQLFRNCTAVERVALPQTLQSIGKYTFGNCSNLLELAFPASLRSVHKTAFSSILQRIYYGGSDWEQIQSGAENADWTARVIFAEAPQPEVTRYPTGLPPFSPEPVRKAEEMASEMIGKSGTEELPKPTVEPALLPIGEDSLSKGKNEITPPTRGIVFVMFFVACAVVAGIVIKRKRAK